MKVKAISFSVIILNFLLVIICRQYLPDILPLHIDLDGNASSSMPYTRLYFYPIASLVLALLVNGIRSIAFKSVPKLDDKNGVRRRYVDICILGITMVVLLSTCVSLTQGRVHLFMFSEPIVMLLCILAVIQAEVKIRKDR